MFKAKLIENKTYYKLRKEHLLLTLLPIPIGVLINFKSLPIWLSFLIIGLYIIVLVLLVIKQRQMIPYIGNKEIEIDEAEIRIKSKKDAKAEIIDLKKIEKIILKKEYFLSQEIIGGIKQNFLILQANGVKRKLCFALESHYMKNQLNKIIENWEAKAFNIEKV